MLEQRERKSEFSTPQLCPDRGMTAVLEKQGGWQRLGQGGKAGGAREPVGLRKGWRDVAAAHVRGWGLGAGGWAH